MSYKFFIRKTIIFIGVALFLSLTFFLYWKTSNNAVIIEQVNTKHRVTDEIDASDSKQASGILSTKSEKVNPQTSEKAPDAKDVKDVKKALDFLDELQQEIHGEKTDVIPKGITSNGNYSQDEMFELIREGISYYDSFLESASVGFRLEITNIDYPGITRGPSGTWEGVFEFSESQIRGKVTRNATQYDAKYGEIQLMGTQQFAFNGETFETLRGTSNGTLLTRRNEKVYTKGHDPRFWGWNLSGEESLVDFIDMLDVQNIKQVDWDGSQVYHLIGSMYEETLNVALWLNPEKSYRPERFVYSLQSEGASQVRVTKDFNFQEVAPDLWFPESAQSVTTITNTGTAEEINIETTTMTLTDVRVNEHIPSSRFSIDPPSGTTVFDMRNRETYTVGGEEN